MTEVRGRLEREPVESINRQLREQFGIDTVTGLPIWRIVWSEDQYEWRHGTYNDITPGGIYIQTVTESRYVPKYRQWIPEKFVLERLVVTPESNEKELNGAKTSYEPIFPFENGKGEALPPRFDVAKLVIDTIYAAQFGTHNLKKYVDDEATQEMSEHNKMRRVDEMVEYLWGDSSGLAGTTITGESVIVPRNFERSK